MLERLVGLGVIIEENEKDECAKYLVLKGHYRFEKLFKYIKDDYDSVTWKDLSNYYRYDVRLRRNLIKYLIMLEEYLRAKVSNEVDYIKSEKINSYSFGELIVKQYNKNIELMSVVELRNKCMHHNQLFFYEGLLTGINNLISALPNEFQNPFIKEINNSSKRLFIKKKIFITKGDKNAEIQWVQNEERS